MKSYVTSDIKEENLIPDTVKISSDNSRLVLSLTSSKPITPSNMQQKKKKQSMLSNMTRTIEYDEMQRMSFDSFQRMLYAEGLFLQSN